MKNNMRNQKLHVDSSSGYKGVSLRANGKWRAYIVVDYKQKNLGHFDTAEEAYAAYCRSAKLLHGDFHRLK
jgi:hypothetical protein